MTLAEAQAFALNAELRRLENDAACDRIAETGSLWRIERVRAARAKAERRGRARLAAALADEEQREQGRIDALRARAAIDEARRAELRAQLEALGGSPTAA